MSATWMGAIRARDEGIIGRRVIETDMWVLGVGGHM